MKPWLPSIALGLMACGAEPAGPDCDAQGLQLHNGSGYSCQEINQALDVLWALGEERFGPLTHLDVIRQDSAFFLTEEAFSCGELPNAQGCATAYMVRVKTHDPLRPWSETSLAHEWAHWLLFNWVTDEGHHTDPRFLDFIVEANNRLED